MTGETERYIPEPKDIIDTPEEADRILSSMASSLFNVTAVQESLDRLKAQLPDKDERILGEKNPLKKIEKFIQDWENDPTAAEMVAMNRRMLGIFQDKLIEPIHDWERKWREMRPAHITSVFARTRAPHKQDILRKIGDETDIAVRFPSLLDIDLEEVAASGENNAYRISIVNERTPRDYPWHMLEHKSIDYRENDQIGQVTEPSLVMDTTVMGYDTVFNKPKSRDEAIFRLKSFIGKNITVLSTYQFMMVTYEGELVRAPGGTAIQLSLRDDIDYDHMQEIVDDETYEALNVNAAVNATHPLFEELIDSKKPIYVLPFSLGLTKPISIGTWFDVREDIESGMPISKEALPAISTYFRGAPYHPIKQFFKEADAVYHQVK